MKPARAYGAVAATLLLVFTAAQARAQAQRAPAAIVHAMTAKPGVPFAGSPRADVTIIEFMDFNCPYCRKLQPDLETLVKTDPKVRVLYKEWPIFGAASVYAAKVALAASWQGEYLQVHNALIASPSRLESLQQIRDVARQAGADLGRLDHDLKVHGAAIDALLSRNNQEAEALGLEGTPGLVIGSTLAFGALPLSDLQHLVAEQRRLGRPSHK
jgi:protein-disulfide isomerase